VAASGWDTKETCEAGTSTIVVFARPATNRWGSGGIALFSVATKYQHGIVFHAGGGRRLRCGRGGVGPPRRGHHRSRLGIDIGGEGFAECLRGEVEVGAFARVRTGERDGPDRRPQKAACELLEHILQASCGARRCRVYWRGSPRVRTAWTAPSADMVRDMKSRLVAVAEWPGAASATTSAA
jgi:hypothetical protein